MPAKNKASLDEIMSKRQFSVKTGPKGDMLTKIYKAPATWNDDERSCRFIMTAQVADRYGDIVVAKGGDLTDFNNNPVVLWAHDNRAAPIGMWGDIKVITGSPKRMEGTATLAPPETTDKADEVSRLLAAGMVRACSIGFMIKDWEPVDKEDPWGGWQFNEWELLECSICSVPANPLALVKAAGGDSSVALQAIELVLDEWTRTPAGTIVPRAAFEKAYRVEKKADAPTLVEVKAIEEEADEPAETPAAETPEQKDFAERIIEGVAKIVAKALGKSDPQGAKVSDLTAEEIDVNTIKDTAVEEEPAPADTEPTEEERAKAEAEAKQKEIDEQEELELRARAALTI